MLRYAFLLVWLGGLLNTSKSQTISGIVLDEYSHKPLSGCLVVQKGQQRFAVTSGDGRFNLQVISKDPVLVFTLLGYNIREYKLRSYKSDTFLLVSKSFELEDVVISAEKQSILNAKNHDVILDFELLNGDLLLLVSGATLNQVRLMSASGKVIARLAVPRRSEKLERDCLGNVHLFSPDSVWQVFYDYVKLSLLQAYAEKEYQKIMGNCVCVQDEDYYFRYMSYRNLRTSYFYFQAQEPGVAHELAEFADTSKIRSFELDYNLQYFLTVRRESHYTMYNESIDEIKRKIEQYREALPLEASYINWLGKVETQLVKRDTTLFMVNYTDTVLYMLNALHHLDYLGRFECLREKNLVHQLFVDETYKDAYLAKFEDNVLCFIRVDLRTGHELARTGIQHVPFLPRKMIIDSGFAYFIQKNLADEQAYKVMKCRL